MDLYQQFIAKSRYSRFLQEDKRRENWEETVDRYMDFMAKHLESKHNYRIPSETYEDLSQAIKNLEVVPPCAQS